MQQLNQHTGHVHGHIRPTIGTWSVARCLLAGLCFVRRRAQRSAGYARMTWLNWLRRVEAAVTRRQRNANGLP